MKLKVRSFLPIDCFIAFGDCFLGGLERRMLKADDSDACESFYANSAKNL
jgi:hypothetical protein